MEDSAGKQQQALPQWVAGQSEALATTQICQEYFKLTKPRITLLIVISTAVGYCYGATSGFSFLSFLHVLLGTALMASGSATLNQWYEQDSDAKMNRTRTRPIPAGTIPSRHAFLFGIAISLLGVIELWTFCGSVAALIGFLTSAGYLLAYTPLKRKSPICTTVGALPGAMPPLIGFAAASGGRLGIEAWVLFAILFLWQFPHFHAIAWLYREDYERGGIRMLAVVRPQGMALTLEILGTLVLLLPVTLAPTFLHMAGKVYFAAALLLDIAFLYFGVQMSRERSRARARSLLLASVIWMPLLFGFLVFNNLRFLI